MHNSPSDAQPQRILVRNADWLVTMGAEREILTDGALAIAGDRIVDIGKTAEVATRFTPDKVIDASGQLVMPGLIDTHVHNSQQLGRGLCDGCDLAVHLLERLYGYEAQLTAEDAYWAAVNCHIEMIRAGTTCFVDPGNYFPDEMARALGDTGLRGTVARITFDVHQTSIGELSAHVRKESAEEALAAAEAAFERVHGLHGGRVRGWFGMRIPPVCSDALIQGMKRLADRHGVGMVLHAGESREAAAASRIKFGMHDVERLAALTALGPNVLLIHMGWAGPRDIALCVQHGVKISCTPSTGHRLGLGSMEFGRFPEMLALGVTVALGSDSAMSSNYVDVVRQMALASGAAKSQRLDPTVLPPETALEMATLHGARAALWEDEIGALTVGRKADVAMFDTRKPEWQPVINPIANLVYAARGGADTVICNGRVLLEHGRLLAFDEQRALLESATRGHRIARATGFAAKILPRWPMR